LSSGLYFLFSLIPALPLHPNSIGRVYGSQYRSDEINAARSRLSIDSALLVGSVVVGCLDLLLFLPPSANIQKRIDEVELQIRILNH
jgi:hypothetical protein